MAAEGQPCTEIARILRLNRNSVTAHLHGDITYPAAVHRRIRIVAPLKSDGWLNHREAAPWIPGHPSAAKMRTLTTTATWSRRRSRPELRSTIVDGRRLTRITWIRAYVAAHFTPGIWIHPSTFECYTSLPAPPAECIGKQLQAISLIDAVAAANAAGIQFSIPTVLVHRATKIERLVGTAVV